MSGPAGAPRRVGILISGSGSNMVALIKAMALSDAAEPALVLSNRPDAGGLSKARALDVPTAVVDHRGFQGDRAGFEAAMAEKLGAAGIDLICLAGFMRILTADTVAAWRGRMLNIHPSLLPAFPGLDTHQKALEAGVALHGCTVHLVTAELDAGPILGQAVVPVRAGETADDLAARVLEMEHRLYPMVLDRFARTGSAGRIAPIGLAHPDLARQPDR